MAILVALLFRLSFVTHASLWFIVHLVTSFLVIEKKINRLLQLHDKKGIFARGIKTIMKSFSHSHWSEKLTVIRMLFYKKAKKGM